METSHDDGLATVPKVLQPIEKGNNTHVGKRFVGLATTPYVKMLCTVDEVAALLSIGRTAAWELVRKRKVKSVKIGRTRRVPVAALQEYVDKLLESVA